MDFQLNNKILISFMCFLCHLGDTIEKYDLPSDISFVIF
ncbi:unnamed protein product [Acanthoscelides obtectus]|uniref:Uncharacterized protein n=1 Tax=Acanthoscelides obtectus TaxID=200917 RepID=A0A9P0PXB6_ACAOB|nr:unnamed protein product [Acanthoscelides obtectus]CAK1634903.1 hypothetical protein AOBTE_LOCUS8954 [Acanthoscelides obtectus]